MGLTGIHDFDSTLAFEALQELDGAGELSAARGQGHPPRAAFGRRSRSGSASGFGDDMLRLGAVKMFADGALGPQTAWMIAPYEGTWSTGIPTMREEQLFEDIPRANAAGTCVRRACHRGCRVPRGAERIRARRSRSSGWTGRASETASSTPSSCTPMTSHALPGFRVIASMQPLHATSDMLIAERYWGARCETAYAWKSLAGQRRPRSPSDPIVPWRSLTRLRASTPRSRGAGQTAAPGPEGWRPAQTPHRGAGRATATRWARRTRRDGKAELGSIVKGKLADLTIIDRDIFEIPSHDILKTVVDATMVGGELVYRDF